MSLEQARNDWHPVGMLDSLPVGAPVRTRLLGSALTVTRQAEGATVTDATGAPCACRIAHGHVWAAPGPAPRRFFSIPEAAEAGRRLVPCGGVQVRTSALRVVENFLDIAHFPFVHTGILGAEPHTEVAPYEVEITPDTDEVLATRVKFHQPQAARSATAGILVGYIYRVPAPNIAILYKTCPARPEARDVIAIFVQPLDEESCMVWAWMALFDDDAPLAGLVQFQQEIFLQDRCILENQVPRKLPLDARAEISTRADRTSVTYRRWLKQRGYTYGAETGPA